MNNVAKLPWGSARTAEGSDGSAAWVVVSERVEHSGVWDGLDCGEQTVDAVRMRDVIRVLADEPGGVALAEHAVECGRDALIGLRENAQPAADGRMGGEGTQVFETVVCGSVDDGEDFKIGALLG